MSKVGRSRAAAAAGALALTLAAGGCASGTPAFEAPTAGIVPAPERLEVHPGAFTLGPDTKIVVPESRVEALPVATYLRDMLKGPTGDDPGVEISPELLPGTDPPAGAIYLRLGGGADRLGPEGYFLDVGPDRVLIDAAAPAGLFYGVQTLRQLLPAAIEKAAGLGPWTVPAVSVEDRPRFAWRGGMLDCSRHFFPKEFVKRWIDLLAWHKLNVFHWHLTDDQGWRIEIKKYPGLTEIGGWRVDREDQPWNAREPQRPGEAATYGGFYTQDDVREIVAYAASRYVTIVPEIEMPGHAKAALTAYPRFSCTGGPFTVPPGGYWPITDVLCPGNDATFEFLDDVLTEVAALFPGPYVHIGGDEVDKTEWRRCPKCRARIEAEGLKDENGLQSYFVRRIEKILAAKGKRLIGWDEILEGGLAPQATVMSWRGTEGGIAAAQAGHDVVMSPTSHCYVDYYQGNPAYEPLAIGGRLPLSRVYGFEPVPGVLSPAEAGHVLGGQANLWTEYVSDGQHAEYMALPRLAALSEALWSPKAKRDWGSFAGRLRGLLARYEAAGLNAARSVFLVAVKAEPRRDGGRVALALETEVPGPDIRYTSDGSDPGPASKRYTKPLVLKRTAEVRAAAFDGPVRLSPAVSSERFLAHLAGGRRVALASPFSEKYAGGGETALTDGLLGSRDIDDGRWQGFEGPDLDAVIDLGRTRSPRRIALRCLQNINAWIFLPASVEFSVSPDGRTYETVGTAGNGISPRQADVVVKTFEAAFAARRVRFVRVRARSVGVVPDWHPGKGGKAWLFADEIVVE
jgi:hexosaminidase